MKHTPGPWKLIKLDGQLYINPDRGEDEYGLITKITGYSGAIGERKERKIANARLIARAPQMLEALEELVAEWDREIEEFQETPGNICPGQTYGMVLARDVVELLKQSGS